MFRRASARSLATAAMRVFDRRAKRMQRDRAALEPDAEVYGYLRSEVGYRLADRVADIARYFPSAVELGCGRGFVAPHLYADNVGHLLQVDMSSASVAAAANSPEVATARLVADEESLRLRPESVDLILSSMAAHWINDLPGFFRRVFEALKKDGVFLLALLGGETLFELRVALQLAESERRGGLASRVSPLVQASDVGSLLGEAGFKLLTLDSDEIRVGYPDLGALMLDLQGMGESGAGLARSAGLSREVLLAAEAIYRAMYADEKGGLPATFQVLYAIGWRPDPATLPQPAQRGSATASFKDIAAAVQTPPTSDSS